MELVVFNIRRIMQEKGLKQRFVAEKSDFTEQEFSNMMNQVFSMILENRNVPFI